MLPTAGPARLTAPANERCACGTSAAPASSACSPATALGPLQNVNRANSNTAAAARPTTVHLRRNFSDSCRVSTSGLYVRSRSSPLSRSGGASKGADRSEEHTSELQSRENLVCRLLLEKKKK